MDFPKPYGMKKSYRAFVAICTGGPIRDRSAAMLDMHRVTCAEALAGFAGRDRRVYCEAVVMIEALRVGPPGQVLPAHRHEFFLKTRYRIAGPRIARRHYAPLARILTEKVNIADLKWLERFGLAVKAVFAKGLAARQFKVRAKPAAEALDIDLWIPLVNSLKAGVARDRGTEGGGIIGKAGSDFLFERNGKAEEITKPPVYWLGRIEAELDGRSVFPEADFLYGAIEFTAQLMHTCGALAVHDHAPLIENRIDTIIGKNAAGGDG